MRYSFTINQKAIIDNNIEIDVIDACLIDYLVMFSTSSSIVKIYENGKTFFFFSHDKIVDDCPLLGLKKDSVYRRLKKLSDIGLLEQYPKSKSIKMTMYSITDKVQLLYNQSKSDTSEIHPKHIGNSSDTHTDENPMYSNISVNSNINYYNNISSENSKKEKVIFINEQLLTHEEAFKVFWDLYDKKTDMAKAKAKFLKLSESDMVLAIEKAPIYVLSTPDKKYRKNALTWLNGQCWNDEVEINNQKQQFKKSNHIDLDNINFQINR